MEHMGGDVRYDSDPSRESDEVDNDGFVVVPPTPPTLPDMESQSDFPEIGDKNDPSMVPVPYDVKPAGGSFASMAARSKSPVNLEDVPKVSRRPVSHRRFKRLRQLYKAEMDVEQEDEWTLWRGADSDTEVQSFGSLFTAIDMCVAGKDDLAFLRAPSSADGLPLTPGAQCHIVAVDAALAQDVFSELCVYALDGRLNPNATVCGVSLHRDTGTDVIKFWWDSTATEDLQSPIRTLLGLDGSVSMLEFHTTKRDLPKKGNVPVKKLRTLGGGAGDLSGLVGIEALSATVHPRPRVAAESKTTSKQEVKKSKDGFLEKTKNRRMKEKEDGSTEEQESKEAEPVPQQENKAGSKARRKNDKSLRNSFDLLDESGSEEEDDTDDTEQVEILEKKVEKKKQATRTGSSKGAKAKRNSSKGSSGDTKMLSQQGGDSSTLILCGIGMLVVVLGMMIAGGGRG